MVNLRKHSLLILMAMLILFIIPMSFAADVDNNATADVIGVDDSSSDIQAVDDSDQLAEEDGEGFIDFEKTSIEIDEGDTATINANVYWYEDYQCWDEVSFQYSYNDDTGATKTGTVKNMEDMQADWGFTVPITGLKASGSPYTVTFTPVEDDDYETFCGYSGGMDPTKINYVTITVKSTAPAEGSVSDIASKVAAAGDGAVIDLTDYDVYDFADGSLTIAKSNITLMGNGDTVIKGYGDGNGLFYITGFNVTIQGIHFVDTNPNNNFTYGGSVNGWGVNFKSVEGGLVKDCNFTDFNSAVVVQGSTDVVIEDNFFNGGYTTVIANDPTVNVEKGSKSLNIYRQSSDITVRGNTFEGPILDGVSIAQGSGSNIVENNTFIGNTYSIYFGGSSTKNSVIRNNKFINCGYFKEGDIVWTELPVISIQKASNDIAIVDNDFVALDNSVLIAAEQGNEAHGFPSSLGNINVTGNNVTLASGASKAYNIVLFSIYCRNGDLNLSAPINVSGNVLPDDVKAVTVETTGDKVFDVETPVELIGTAITASPITIKAGNNGNLKITLKDQYGNPIANDLIVVQVDGEPLFIGPTDANGVVNVPVKYASATTKFAYISYVDTTGKYVSSLETVKITVVKKATTLTAKKATLKVKKAKKIKVTLKSEGKALAKKQVTIKVNGKTFKAKTNAKGVATIKVKVTKKGTFKATVKFAGDGAYKAVTKKVKIKVKK